ncbi:MAG: hypothetical protein H0W50_11550 [Parachlamydiaceae bacterium]|nr:hypothetical protein [Parachlamydiaceae bacterium]
MLSLLKDEPALFKKAVKHTEALAQGLKSMQERIDTPFQVNHVGTMFTLFLTDQPVRNLKDAMTCDTGKFKKLHQGLLNEGIYTAPSQFEANFMSALHSDKDIEDTLRAYEKTLKTL